VFDVRYVNDNMAFDCTDLDSCVSVQGLQDVVLLSGGARVTNVSKVTAVYGLGLEDMADLYSAELANPANWVVRDSASNLLIGITSVAYSAVFDGWIITVNAADPNYVPGNPVTISLAFPSVLAANGVSGFESPNLAGQNYPFITPN
jgi:hypothetical protein